MLTRIDKLLQILIENTDYITTKNLSDMIGVSDRTIRTDLDKVASIISQYHMTLERKPSIGIKINGNKRDREQFILKYQNSSNEQYSEYSPEGRKRYILNNLLHDKKHTYIKYLTDNLYASRSTIEKDLVEVANWLKKFELRLVRRPNGSLSISGIEKDIRNAMFKLVELESSMNKSKSNSADENLINMLNKSLDIDLAEVTKIVRGAEDEIGIKFSYESFNNLITHIAITIQRIKDGKTINLTSFLQEQLSCKEESKISQNIAKRIEKKFTIVLPKSEISYLTLHIIGAKFENNLISDLKIDYQGNDIYDVALNITNEFLSMVQKVLGIDFSERERLVNGLVLHLVPTVNRIEYGLNLHNPLLSEIKQNYSSIYGVSWLINGIFKKYIGKKVGEDEIGYITLHIAAAIERSRKKIKVAVVCTTGIGSSQLLTIRLEEAFPQLQIEAVSMTEITSYQAEQVDLILSTIPLNTNKPYLIISSMLKQSEINRIRVFINQLNQKPPITLFSEEDIVIENNQTERFEILKKMAIKSVEDGSVEEGFYESVLSRETINSTEIGEGVVLAHGFTEYVRRSKIMITILNKKVHWSMEYVDIVFMLMLTNEDVQSHAYQLDWFYRSLDNKEFINKMKGIKKAHDGYELIVDEIKKKI